MRKWARSTGLLFCAVASVYSGPGTYAASDAQVNGSDTPTKVKLIDNGDAAGASSQSSPAKVAISPSGTFSIQINGDVSVVQILRMIGNQAQLSIIPSKEVRGTVPAMDLYNVTVPEALDAILQSNGMAWRQRGNLIYVYTQKELQDQEKAARKQTTRTFTLHYIPAAEALELVKPVLSAEAVTAKTRDAASGIDNGGDTSSGTATSGLTSTGGDTESGVDMVVLTDYPENLKRAADIIQQVDRRPQQILVEATILEADLTENNAMGIDFSLMGGLNFDTILGNNTTVGTALSGNILNAAGNGSGPGTPANNVGQGYAGFTTGNFDTNVGNNGQGGLQIGIVRNNLGVFISALESVADTTVLANPKVLVLNKQAGEVQVGQQLGYQTTTVTQTTSTQTVQFLNTGTILSFRPYIGDDGFVRMEIHPENSTGNVTNNLPDKNTTEVTSNVMVKDGNTIVIGGLFQDSTTSSRNQVPILGNIPIVGALFRSKQDQTRRQEIIILLTPHIIKDDAAYSKSSEAEAKEAEKMRVGVRKGMMWFGRERLAESAYENAEAELARTHPNMDLVLWHLNCAINLNPRFIEAIDLKQKITGREVTDVDNSAIRPFVREQIMAENAEKPATMPSQLAAPPPATQSSSSTR
jgi:type IV pilus secretin PilQ/predicted competence protein